MGDKRSDEHNINPAEKSSAGDKRHGEGRSGDARVDDERKPNSSSRDREPLKAPDSGKKPEPGDLQGKKGSAPAPKREDESRNDVDRRIDEAGEESFPASDPPAY